MPSVNNDNQKTGKAYWRSLDELAETAEFRRFVEKEFADYQPEHMLNAGPTRRSMLKLMGASMALAGASAVSGCRRWPERELAPYNERPEGRIPGQPVYYATASELAGVAKPLLISNVDGRPTKVEGNVDHAQSRGAADTFSQASVLEMYDPERSRHVLHNGERSNWNAFSEALGSWEMGDGGAVAVLSESTASPGVAAMRQRLQEAMPNLRWYEYEPLNRDAELAGAEQALGSSLRTHLNLENARVIVCFDADILGTHPNSIQYARQWASRRDPDAGEMNRMWAADPAFTVTSTNAEHRLPTQAGRIANLVQALVAELGIGGSAPELEEREQQWIAALAADLQAHRGESVVTAGPRQPAEVHAAVLLINEALGNFGQTVALTDESHAAGQGQQIRQLADRMRNGEVQTLVMLGGNPVYDAPADADFREALEQVEHSVHLSHYVDETSKQCEWHLSRAHYLEAWGAVRSWDGTITVQQPQIRPLYGSRSAIEVLAMLTGETVDGQQIVRQSLSDWIANEREWRKALHDGLVPGSGFEPVSASEIDAESVLAALAQLPEATGVELSLTPDNKVYDGRFANNGWLQELPHPITKLTWDNAAIVGPATAQQLGVSHGDMIRLEVGDRSMTAAVFVVPGTARNAISVSLGYGRTSAGYVGNDVGFDAYQVRFGENPDVHSDVEVTPLGRHYTLATTQVHHAIDTAAQQERESRAFHELIRTATLDEYEEYLAGDPKDQFSLVPRAYLPKTEEGRPLQLFDPPADWSDGYQWGMSVDLNKCIGCGACVVACQAENNIPIVGKGEVARSREMHWIRVDRYYGGDPENPDVAHQPMTCQHCENAPCEQVCPVAATVHDTAGLNVMVYNRCIGTRYCSNNCPYKVRRFNFFDWHAKPVRSGPSAALDIDFPDQRQLKHVDPVRRMQFNPEVTVRMRGVMEKCTFCTQRIKTTTINVRNAVRKGERESTELRDGEIIPACAQTCPTEAIRFGDINNASHSVSRDRLHPRMYEILRHLNTRTRLRYLAKVTNPSARLTGQHDESTAEPEHA